MVMSEIIWDGKGLPPIGYEVEAFIYSGDGGKEWLKRRVLGYGSYSKDPNNKIIVDSGERQFDLVYASDFRPIKSERDNAIEEIIKIGFSPEIISNRNIAAAIYDAGYRKVKTDAL